MVSSRKLWVAVGTKVRQLISYAQSTAPTGVFNAAPELYVMGNKGASKDDLTPHWLDVRPLTASERALRRWFDPRCGFARKRRDGNDCGVPQNHIQERILWNSTSTFQIPDDKIPGAKTAHTDDRID